MRQRTYLPTLRQYYPFTPEEIRGLIVSILITAFIVSFKEWGYRKFDIMVGLRNFFDAALIITLVMVVFNSGQRMFGIFRGFKVEYKPWIYGLIIGLVLVFVSNGNIWFLAPGGIIVYHLAGHRLGYFRYGLNYGHLGWVGMMGPLSTLALAIIAKVLVEFMPANVLVHKLMLIAIAFTVFNLIPIPPLAGSHLFYATRLGYMFCAGGILGACLMLNYLPVAWVIPGMLLVAVASWLSFYVFFERNVQ